MLGTGSSGRRAGGVHRQVTKSAFETRNLLTSDVIKEGCGKAAGNVSLYLNNEREVLNYVSRAVTVKSHKLSGLQYILAFC